MQFFRVKIRGKQRGTGITDRSEYMPGKSLFRYNP